MPYSESWQPERMVDEHPKLSSPHLQPSDDTGMGNQGSRSQRLILSSGQGIAWSLRLYVSLTTFALCSRAGFTYTKSLSPAFPRSVCGWLDLRLTQRQRANRNLSLIGCAVGVQIPLTEWRANVSVIEDMKCLAKSHANQHLKIESLFTGIKDY